MGVVETSTVLEREKAESWFDFFEGGGKATCLRHAKIDIQDFDYLHWFCFFFIFSDCKSNEHTSCV